MSKKNRFLLALIAPSILLAGCFFDSQKLVYNEAVEAEASQNFEKAVKYYERTIKRQPDNELALKASLQAYRVSLFQLNDFIKAAHFLRHRLLHQKTVAERKNTQEKLADLFYDKMQDYKSALELYAKLLLVENSIPERVKYKERIARSYFYLGDFFQALVEIDELIAMSLGESERFESLLFKGNIHLTTKKLKEALIVFEELKVKYPERALQEKIDITMAVAYEEMEQFDRAIDILKEFRRHKPDSPFVDLKIKRLEQRKMNRPGAKGLRK